MKIIQPCESYLGGGKKHPSSFVTKLIYS